METGRKFWISVGGIACVMGYAVYCGEKGIHVETEGVFSAVATIVLSLCGGNAAASLAAAFSNTKQTSVTETVTREIKARRASGDAEDTP